MWSDLSMQQRADLMDIYLSHGVTLLDEMRRHYDSRDIGTANAYGEGGNIHIKPENRGKFTALKKRTGHSATWFKEHGTPAQKKMATFALNARHWKHGLGGNLFDGTSQSSQQMDRPNIFRYDDGRYVYQAAPDTEEIEVSPINTLLPNPSQWTYQDASGKVYTPHAAQVDTGSIIQDEERNPLVRAANNYFREAAYRAKDGTLALQGKYTMPAIAASALLPLAGEAAYPLLTNPYIDAAATSAFAGHGLNHAINEGIDGWGDAAMTALEITPLGRVAKPMWDAGKEGLQYAAKELASDKLKWLYNEGDIFNASMKYNPNNFYREISKEAIDDAINSGVIRSGNTERYIGPFFGKGYTPWQREKYIIEGYPEKNDWIYANPYENAVYVMQDEPEVGKALMKEAFKKIPKNSNVGAEAFPYSNGSINSTPTTNFDYWKKYPLLGWRKNKFNVTETPTITAENAASITPEQWTAAQDAAMTAMELTPLGRLTKPVFREIASAIEGYRYPFGRPQVPKKYTAFKPKVRTRVGEVEIDNPNLLYHLDRGDGAGAYSNRGAYVEDGFLFPGTPKAPSDTPYSWWNKGKPYATNVGGTPMTRLMTATKDTPGMIHIRSQNYPIGQWNGKSGFVLPSEYVNPEGVNVSGNTYILEPNYGWKKTPSEIPTIEWADATRTPQITAENEPLFARDPSSYFAPYQDITTLSKNAEAGRQDLIDDITSEWRRQRMRNAGISEDNIDKIVTRQKGLAEEVPFDYSKTAKEIDGLGVTSPRPFNQYTLPNGVRVNDFNTGLDVGIAKDMGSMARRTGYHESGHYSLSNALGTQPDDYIVNPSDPVFSPIAHDYTPSNSTTIARGESWQHQLIDYNQSLLPPKDPYYETIMDWKYDIRKDAAAVKEKLKRAGATEEQASKIIADVKDADYMWNTQEQDRNLKEFFHYDVKPLLKNPNDELEIEKVLTDNPDIINNNYYIKQLMTKLRPGTIKDYAKVLAGMLSTLPAVNTLFNNEKQE